MNLRAVFPSLLLLLVCASMGLSQEFANGVQMTTLKAPWVLRILGQDLDISNVQAKPDQQSAYFMMTSESTKLNVSVFIEPLLKCKTPEECRDVVLGDGNAKWGKVRPVAMGRIGEAAYFEFFRDEVDGKTLNVEDLYAEFVKDGYWVDMHISKVQYEKKDHALFEAVVKDAAFVSKGAKSSSAFDTTFAKAFATAGSWLDLWDNGKCEESFRAMSSINRAKITEANWCDYFKGISGYVGALKSRQPIAAAFTDPHPGKPERPLAMLAFQSDFANHANIVEFVGLLPEKDGRWVVTLYLPR